MNRSEVARQSYNDGYQSTKNNFLIYSLIDFFSRTLLSDHNCDRCHSVFLEGASPGVGGGIIFPLTVSVGFAFKLLFTDILIGVVSN